MTRLIAQLLAALARGQCRLCGGHHWLRTHDGARIYLECTHCPATTRGWSASAPLRLPRRAAARISR